MNKIFVMGYDTRNIGDEIQTIATTDILDEMGIEYSYVNRDRISSHQFMPGDHNVVVMNGWFTNGYGLDAYYSTRQDLRESVKISWPPTGVFHPLAYSFCLSEWGADRHTPDAFTSSEAKRFYEKSEGFGCRDTHTYKIMRDLGVDSAYVSKCLTLTLDPKKYRRENSMRDLVFVDVPENVKRSVTQAAQGVMKDYNVKSYTHEIYDEMVESLDRVKYAKALLSKYANAGLVVTSRLHVALPCLAFGTPCLFYYESENSRYSDYISYMYSVNGGEWTQDQWTLSVKQAISEPKSWNDTSVRSNFERLISYTMSDAFVFAKWCEANGLKEHDGVWSKVSNGNPVRVSKWENGVQMSWTAVVGGVKYDRVSKFSTYGEFTRAWESGTATSEWAESNFVGDIEDVKPVHHPDLIVWVKSSTEEMLEVMEAWRKKILVSGVVFGQLDPDINSFEIHLKQVSHMIMDISANENSMSVTVRFLDTQMGRDGFDLFKSGAVEFFVNQKTKMIDLRQCSTK
jgi:hypothetical protein